MEDEEGVSIRQSRVRRHDKSSSNVSGGLQNHKLKQKCSWSCNDSAGHAAASS
jgi:hypothetical protein